MGIYSGILQFIMDGPGHYSGHFSPETSFPPPVWHGCLSGVVVHRKLALPCNALVILADCDAHQPSPWKTAPLQANESRIPEILFPMRIELRSILSFFLGGREKNHHREKNMREIGIFIWGKNMIDEHYSSIPV